MYALTVWQNFPYFLKQFVKIFWNTTIWRDFQNLDYTQTVWQNFPNFFLKNLDKLF